MSCAFDDERVFGTIGCFDKALQEEDKVGKHLDTSRDSEVFVVISHLDFEVVCYWSIMEPEPTDHLALLPHQIIHKIEPQNGRRALKEKYEGTGNYMPRGLDLVGAEGRGLIQETDSGSKLPNSSPHPQSFAV